MKIIPITPNRNYVASIIKKSSEYGANLYPPEGNHQDDVSELSKANVFFVGAFESDNLIGTGAVKVLSQAIGLYKKLGYIERNPFGEYKPDPLSIFMEKQLSAEQTPSTMIGR